MEENIKLKMTLPKIPNIELVAIEGMDRMAKHMGILDAKINDFKNLKNYVNGAKACLAPMDITIDGNEIHHHKSLQYLAMGKPIISPIFNDEINNDKFILGYKNDDEALNILRNIDTNETPDVVKKRINFAKQFLFSNLTKKVEAFLN